MQDIHLKLKPEIKDIIDNELPDKEYIEQIIGFHERLQENLEKHPYVRQDLIRINDDEILFMVYLKRKDWKNARRKINSPYPPKGELYMGANCYAIIKAIEGALCI